ncbi:MAG: glucose-1-phosphate adenylyltransferase [Zavarzinella sp.]
MRDVLTIILAGGRGKRLDPLTRHRAKPAVPFGGIYRIIDFTLSNCLNSDLRQVMVLAQYKSRSLDQHIREGWNILSRSLGEYIEILSPQQRTSEEWYRGTADAIYHNIYTIEAEKRRYTLILAGDHVYRMDYRPMIQSHIERGADLTIGCIPVPITESDQFGIMQVDDSYRIRHFVEKPATCPPMPGSTDHCLGSMGIYVFNTDLLFEQLIEDQNAGGSHHDFGHNLIPMLIETHRVFAFPFTETSSPGGVSAYWRDVGTIHAFYEANIDLTTALPQLDLYDRDWPIRTYHEHDPPPKLVHNMPGEIGAARRGEAFDSLLSPGCIISGGHVRGSVLSPRVRVNSYAVVEDSILFDGVQVGRNCRIRRTIVDKNTVIPCDTTVGFDLDLDRRRGFHVSEEGIVVIPRDAVIQWHS